MTRRVQGFRFRDWGSRVCFSRILGFEFRFWGSGTVQDSKSVKPKRRHLPCLAARLIGKLFTLKCRGDRVEPKGSGKFGCKSVLSSKL